MSELLGHFHFLRPLWLLALVPAALAGWLLWRQLDPLHGYRASIAPHLLAHLVIRAGKTSFLRPEVVLLCVLPLSILAMAGPSWRQEPSPFAEDQAAAIVVMKIAPSMKASDLQPSRLERAQHKLHDWLALRPGARAGLIAYSGSAHLVMPLTRDSRIVEQMAQALDPSVMPVQGEALADALRLAQQQLERAGVPGSIVVMTDSIAASQLSALAAYRQTGGPPVQMLAMVGQYEPAMARYDRALQLRPGWEAAQINREVARQRAERVKQEGGEGTGGQLSADAIVFTKGKNPSQQEGEKDTSSGGAMSDAELRNRWLRRVQTAPADFLRAKFAYQAALKDSKP